MLRTVGLDDHISLLIAPAGSPCRLGDQLECPLRRPEIRDVQRNIRRNDPRKSHIAKVQSLGDDLRADEDLRLAAAKGFQLPRQFSFSLDRIQIQPLRRVVRKQLRNSLLQLFRPAAEIPDVLASALRALVRRRLVITAVVAHRLSARLVIRQRKSAAGALGHVAALPAGHEGGIPSPVQEQDHLSARLQRILHLSAKFFAEDRTVAPLQFFSHIDDAHLRLHHLVITFRQLQELIDPLLRPLIGNHRRSRTPQKQDTVVIFVLHPLQCHFDGVVFRRMV